MVNVVNSVFLWNVSNVMVTLCACALKVATLGVCVVNVVALSICVGNVIN